MPDELRFIDLRTEGTEKLITSVYNDLLAQAFGPDELDSLATVSEGLHTIGTGETWGLCALDGATAVGCILAYPHTNSGVLLLGYIAVAAGGRDRGIGGKLIAEAKARWLGRSDMTLMVGEVEDPRYYSEQGGIDPKRRIAFYAKLDVQVVVGPYFQPRLDADKRRVRNLFLSILGRTDTGNEFVSGKQIGEFLVEYFRTSGEGDDWPRPDDVEGNELLVWYRRHASVPLHPIADYAEIKIPDAGVLNASDWVRVKREFLERNIDTVRQRLIDAAIITDNQQADAQVNADDSDDKMEALGDELGRSSPWTASLRTYGGTAILAFLVFAWGMAMWELTGDHERVRKNIAKAVAAYRDAMEQPSEDCLPPHPNAPIRRLTEFILYRLAGRDRESNPTEKWAWKSQSLLFDAMSVEASVYSGSAAAAQKQAHQIVQNTRAMLQELVDFSDADHDLADLLVQILDDHRVYYGAIGGAAEALQSAAEAGPNSDNFLKTAIAQSTAAQETLTRSGDVLASELSAYHLVLQAWRRRLAIPPTDVRLNKVRITCLYPFTLPDIPGTKAQQTILQHSFAKTRPNGGNLPTIGGVQPSGAPHPVLLSDLWTWGGRGKCLQKSIALPLPDLTLHIPGEDMSSYTYAADIRFNELGNHYLRLEVELEDGVTVSNLNQAIRRATAYAGQQRITCEKLPGKTWTSLAKYAEETILDVGNWIIATSGADHDSENPMVFQPDLDYHVIVAIRRASVQESDGSSRRAKQQEIMRTFGPVLAQPLNREVTALDEWICWDFVDSIPNLLGDVHMPADFAIGTEHATILCMPSTPNWSHLGYEEVAEFVGSLPTLVRRWKSDFDYHIDTADNLLQREATDEKSVVTENDLNDARAQLRTTISEIRNQQFYLIPTRLVSLSAERTFLANLYGLVNIPSGTQEIDSYLKRGDIAIERITTREERLRAHSNEAFQTRMQWILFFVSLFSFSSVLALILQLLYGAEIPGLPPLGKDDEGHHGYGEVDFVVGGIIYLSLSAGLALYLWLYRKKFTRKRISELRKALRIRTGGEADGDGR